MSRRNKKITPPYIPDSDTRRVFADVYDHLNRIRETGEQSIETIRAEVDRSHQAGRSAVGRVQNLGDALVAGFEAQSVNILAYPIAPGETPGRLWMRNSSANFIEGQHLRVTNPATWRHQVFVTSSEQVTLEEPDQAKGMAAAYVEVEPKTSSVALPAGSFVFVDSETLLLGLLAGTSAFRIFAESSAIGEVIQDADVGSDEVEVNLWGHLNAGDVIDFLIERSSGNELVRASLNEMIEEYQSGEQTLHLADELTHFIPEGAFVKLNGVSFTSKFHVDPGRVKLSVERERAANGIGTVAVTPWPNNFPWEPNYEGPYNELTLIGVDEEVALEDEQKLIIVSPSGNSEIITVDGDQQIGPADAASPATLAIEPFEPSHLYLGMVSHVEEPGYRQTGRLNVAAGNVRALAEAVGLTEDGSEWKSQAILNLQADLEGAEAALSASISSVASESAHIIRQDAPAPTHRGNGEPLENGDVWVDTSDDNKAWAWDGSQWTEFNETIFKAHAALELQVGEIEDDMVAFSDQLEDLEVDLGTIGARTALTADANGNLAVVELLSGTEGSFVGISADLVLVNGLNIEEDGAIHANFDGTIEDGLITNLGETGYAVDRSGKAVFNQVEVRGYANLNSDNDFGDKTLYAFNFVLNNP